MFKRSPRSAPGRLREGPIRVAVMLLMALQLVASPVAASADVHPAETDHAEHLSGTPEACQPFHDELTCITCRVLSNEPIGAPGAPALLSAPTTRAVLTVNGDVSPRDALPDGALRARAPPRT